MPERIPQCQSMNEAALIDANAAYYRAFAARDLGAMNDLWAEEGCSCVHPGWPVIVGRSQVLASYRDILGNPGQEAVAAHDPRTLVEGADGRVFCIEEVGGGLLLATNWFRWSGERWRLVHHQASPLAPPPSPRRDEKRSFH